VHQH